MSEKRRLEGGSPLPLLRRSMTTALQNQFRKLGGRQSPAAVTAVEDDRPPKSVSKADQEKQYFVGNSELILHIQKLIHMPVEFLLCPWIAQR